MFIIVDTNAGDPQFSHVHGPYPTSAAAIAAVVAAGEGGRLDDTLWVHQLKPSFP